MCGIVGVFNYSFNGVSLHQREMFNQMLYCNAVRGMHGTGMFAVDEKGNMHRNRVGGPPHQLFGTPEWKGTEKWLAGHYVRFMVGHNRYATRGQHITPHAHPFRDGHIALVHNGTLENEHKLPDHKKYDVDSELLCHAFATQGAENVIPMLEGAWTLVWWDSKKLTLNILRNDQRPLFIAHYPSDKLVAIASEEIMLEWVMRRNYYGFELKIEEVATDKMLSFSLDKIEPTITPLAGKPSKKEKHSYFEDMFKDANDACATACAATADVEVVVPNAGKGTSGTSSAAGDWNKGKTGKVTYLPRQGGSGGKSDDKRNLTENKSWKGAEFIHEICKGDAVTVRIVDFDNPEDKSPDFFVVRCSMDEYPDIDFRCHVKGDQLMDSLYNAKYGLRATVFTIMKSNQPPALNPHRIYLRDPQPAQVWTAKSGVRPTQQ